VSDDGAGEEGVPAFAGIIKKIAGFLRTGLARMAGVRSGDALTI
jgi:hypothetical protein